VGAAANADPNRTDTTREDRLVRGPVGQMISISLLNYSYIYPMNFILHWKLF